MPRRKLLRGAHVEDGALFRNALRIDGGGKSVQQVGGNEPHHIDGTFRGIIRRSVTQLHLREVAHRAAEFHRRRNDVYLLLHIVGAHRLRAQHSAVGREKQLAHQLRRTGIICGVRKGERINLAVIRPRLFQLFFVQSHGRRRERAHLCHTRAEHLSAVRGRAARDVVRNASALSVCGPCERNEGLSAVRAEHAHRVARRIHVGKRRAHQPVDRDAAVRGDFRSRGFCERRFGRNSERKHGYAEFPRRPVGKRDVERAVRAVYALHSRARAHVRSRLFQLIRKHNRKFGVERGKQLGRKLRKRDRKPRPQKIFRGFHTYETAARNERGLHSVRTDVTRKPRGVAHVAEGEHALSAPSERLCRSSRRKHKFVISFFVFPAVLFAHADGLCRGVYADGFRAHAHVYAEAPF